MAWSGTGALAATVGKALSGGADGSPASADYTDFLAAIEPYKFDVLIYDGTDTTVQDVEASGVGPMPTTVEVVITGARFVGRIDCGSDALECSVMARGLSLMEAIGGKSGGGLGQVMVEHDADGALWVTWMTAHREDLRATLLQLAERLGGEAKKPKKAKPEAA